MTRRHAETNFAHSMRQLSVSDDTRTPWWREALRCTAEAAMGFYMLVVLFDWHTATTPRWFLLSVAWLMLVFSGLRAVLVLIAKATGNEQEMGLK